MKRPIRVAQVATAGISVRLLLLDHIERLRALGYEVEAVCGDDADVESVRRRGIVVRTVPMEREPSLLPDLKAVVALARLFRERDYHVVHSHTPKAGLLAPVAARLACTPTIIHTIHGLLVHDRAPPLFKLAGAACEFWTGAWCQRLLSQSREDVDTAVQLGICPPDRIQHLGNGIDVRRFSKEAVPAARQQLRATFGFRDDDIVVGMVGRLVREKGFEEFFAAMGRVMGARPRVRALVVAPEDDDQSDRLDPQRLLERVDRARTVLLGRRDDLPELYAAMDLFVLPSYREGIPRTLMEASAMALPVIATRIRGCREVVREGETGLLLEPRDEAALERMLLRLIDEPATRARLGAAGCRHIRENFDSEAVLGRLATFYGKYVGRPASARWPA
jgi:glycosyltransferase involved in cell wall biosynthesis